MVLSNKYNCGMIIYCFFVCGSFNFFLDLTRAKSSGNLMPSGFYSRELAVFGIFLF